MSGYLATEQAGKRVRSYVPSDLRETGQTNDPLFNRPLVQGSISTGVVEVRRPGSDLVERIEAWKPKQITKEGTTMSTRDKRLDTRLDQVAKMYDDGMTYDEMSRALKTSRSTIGKLIQKARQEGLLTTVRSQGPAPKTSKAMHDMHQRLVELEKRVETMFEDLRQEIGENKEKQDHMLKALSELTRRVADLESGMQHQPDLTRELIDLLRLAMGDRPKVA